MTRLLLGLLLLAPPAAAQPLTPQQREEVLGLVREALRADPSILRDAAGVDTVVVTGVSTSGCVRASATDALTAGFRPQVVRTACADRTLALHEANLADLDAKYADVCDLPEALAHLGAGSTAQPPSPPAGSSGTIAG